jgi:glycosyltransferase involved in cell wall biosynthesis
MVMDRNLNKLKIAFVIDTLSVPAGGTEGQLLHLLAGLNRDRFQPKLFCLQSSTWLERAFDLCPSESLDARLSPTPGALVHIGMFSRKLRREQFDIVQTYFRDANTVGVLAARLAGVKVIVSSRRGVPHWKSGAELLFLKGINRMVTCFVANGRTMRERAVREEGIDADRIEVIHNGLDRERFRYRGEAARAAVRRGLGLPPRAPVVGIVANLRPVKGLPDFIEAAGRVRTAFPDARFLIIGQGAEAHALRDLALRRGLGERAFPTRFWSIWPPAYRWWSPMSAGRGRSCGRAATAFWCPPDGPGTWRRESPPSSHTPEAPGSGATSDPVWMPSAFRR